MPYNMVIFLFLNQGYSQLEINALQASFTNLYNASCLSSKSTLLNISGPILIQSIWAAECKKCLFNTQALHSYQLENYIKLSNSVGYTLEIVASVPLVSKIGGLLELPPKVSLFFLVKSLAFRVIYQYLVSKQKLQNEHAY